MSEEANNKETAEQAAPAEAGGSKKTLIIAAVVGVLLLGAGVPVAFMLLKTPEVKVEEPVVEPVVEEAEPVQEGEGEEAALAEGEEALGAIVPFDTFLVNLKGGKYIRLQLQAELETPDIPKRLYSRLVPIRDEIITHLTQQTAESLESVQGKEQLKTKFRSIINEQLRREDVRRIYFTQFVIQ